MPAAYSSPTFGTPWRIINGIRLLLDLAWVLRLSPYRRCRILLGEHLYTTDVLACSEHDDDDVLDLDGRCMDSSLGVFR